MTAFMTATLLVASGGFLMAVAGRQVHDLAKTSSSRLYALITSPSERGDDEIARAVRSGLVLRHRSVVALEVDRKRWQAAPGPTRERLLTALAHSAFGRDLRGGEVVAVYAGKSRAPLSVKRAANL
jgi:hypothetical protein